MDDLIEALTIFRKYTDTRYPTNCVHDWLGIMRVPKDVTEADRLRLEQLGFLWSDEYDSWGSYRFGSA